MKRNKREHGRILSVETLTRGDALAVDVAAGATSITVNDAGDFDEDGGWLYIGAQAVAYLDCDDDAGVLTLADPLAAAGEEGDPVHVWSDLYAEVVDYQLAHVELDGEYDNPEPVVAEVAEGVGDLPEGDRGKAGESCTLLRVADDEWEVVGVGGRARKSRGVRWEQADTYTLTAGDVTAGSATMLLSHRPINEALTCVLAGVPQRPTEWTINYDAQALTIPLDGWEQAGDVLWVHYAYRKGVTTTAAQPDTVDWPTFVMSLDPTAWYRVGEAPGAALMVDSTGHGYDVNYSVSTVGRLGKPGLLAYGDGDTCGDFTSLIGANRTWAQPTALTFFVLASLDAAAGTGTHNLYQRAGGYPIQIGIRNGYLFAEAYSSEGFAYKTATSAAALPTNGTVVALAARMVWGSGAAGSIEVYVNGVQSGTTANGLTSPNRSDSWGLGSVPGRLDEAAFWHQIALSPAQIADLSAVALTGQVAS